MATKASQATRTVTYQKSECPFCTGGHVDLYIAGEHVETIECPECKGTGYVSRGQYNKALDSINAMNAAIADERFKY